MEVPVCKADKQWGLGWLQLLHSEHFASGAEDLQGPLSSLQTKLLLYHYSLHIYKKHRSIPER